MARRVLPLAAGAAVLLSLAGCGDYRQAQRPAWRTQAENACMAQHLVHMSAYVQPASPIDGPGICGLTQPLHVTALLDGEVALNTRYTLDCPMIAALNDWLTDVVEPAAERRFNSRVVEINSMGTYSCRGINGMAGARLSEHAFGNAMDIGGFRLADGREITIVRDWYHGDQAAQAFLRDVHAGACSHFTTTLGPGYNIFHYNHFHVDLAMHGNTSTGPRRICRPTPQLMPDIEHVPEHAPDGLPEAPPMDEDLDISQAGAANAQALALHEPGRGDLDAAIPPPAPMASYRRQPAPAYRAASADSPPPPRQSSDPSESDGRGDPVARSTYAAEHRPQAAPGSLYRSPGGLAPDGGYHAQTTAYAAERRPAAPGSAYQPHADYSGYRAPPTQYATERRSPAAPGSAYEPPADIGYHAAPTTSADHRGAAVPGSRYQPPDDVGTARPQRGTVRADGAFVPEGRPNDWDLPSQ